MQNHILIIDDEIHMQKLIKTYFRKEVRKGEYEFYFAIDGQEALEKLDSHPEIEVLFCDINMPRITGLQLLARLKKMPILVKTIMVTAYGNMDNIREAMNQGAFDFVTKPIDFTDLKKTVRKAIDELNQIREGEEARLQLPITQKELEKTHEKARYLEEIDQLKSQFFTNISHEFRTPLTVIEGITDQILSNPTKWAEKGGGIIKRNTKSLLNLINQILDLRKLESGKLQLSLIQGNIIPYLRYMIESFQSLSESKRLEIFFTSQKETLIMDYDPEKMLRIFTNILSNAIKFTPEGGNIQIEVEVSQNSSSNEGLHQLKTTIKDSGIGIPSDKLPHIFDRFYQVDGSSTRKGEGTGIGLSLVRELVQLLDGSISIESEEGKGTTFTLFFPITKESTLQSNPISEELFNQYLLYPEKESINSLRSSIIKDSLPSLLIIEDNPDVLAYIISCLEDHYSLFIARDGQEGIEIAFEHTPDLIISDVMMPRKDGFEVCDTLKNDDRTSHIPIVILTAKVDHESRIKGLKRGADAYLAKPFNKEELFIRLEKLLELRRQLQTRYTQTDPSSLNTTPEYEQEDQFITRINEILEENLIKTSFNVSDLCHQIGMSRTNLHRKITALTAGSTTSYIKRFRLEKAKSLLQTSDDSVTNIAYKVGFNDPAYFTRVFKIEFGYSPKKLRG